MGPVTAEKRGAVAAARRKSACRASSGGEIYRKGGTFGRVVSSAVLATAMAVLTTVVDRNVGQRNINVPVLLVI